MNTSTIGHNRWGSRLAQVLLNAFFILFSVSCVLPILTIISVSLSDEKTIYQSGFSIIPLKPMFLAYEFIFANPTRLLNAYGVTTVTTVCGTIASLALISMAAYALSRTDFKYRGKITFYIWLTMLFSGGLVPWYILIAQWLRMKNSILALIVPALVSPFNILLIRTFMQKIPFSIVESAKIDGAREFTIFTRLILPLSLPSLATVGLFISLQFWNEWYLGLLFIDKDNLLPLQLLLQKLMSNLEAFKQTMDKRPFLINDPTSEVPGESVRMAMCILAAGPMLFVFQFFRKYFVSGLTIGAIKG